MVNTYKSCSLSARMWVQAGRKVGSGVEDSDQLSRVIGPINPSYLKWPSIKQRSQVSLPTLNQANISGAINPVVPIPHPPARAQRRGRGPEVHKVLNTRPDVRKINCQRVLKSPQVIWTGSSLWDRTQIVSHGSLPLIFYPTIITYLWLFLLFIWMILRFWLTIHII